MKNKQEEYWKRKKAFIENLKLRNALCDIRKFIKLGAKAEEAFWTAVKLHNVSPKILKARVKVEVEKERKANKKGFEVLEALYV